MDDALRVQVRDGFCNGDRNAHRGRDGQPRDTAELTFALEPLAERFAFDILQDDVDPTLSPGSKDLDDGGMVEPKPDLLFPTKALVKHHVAFVLRIRHLEHDGPAIIEVAGSVDA